MGKELFIILSVLIIFIYLLYRYFITKDLFNNIKEKEDDNKMIVNNNKIIQYFGGDYCPFSNTTSNAYKVIKDFEEMYGGEVTIKYYWVGKDDDIMKELDVQYVPTILNGNNVPIELQLPENTDIKGLSNDELKDILLETIYNKL
jgi:predicted SpoU family rRNA methylase